MWGLYTGPARTSGLVEGDPTRLAPAAREFVDEQYLPRLGGRNGRYANGIREILGQKRSPLAIEKSDACLAAALPARLTAAQRDFYRAYLLEAFPGNHLTQGRQTQFVELLPPSLRDPDWRFSPPAIGHFAKQPKARHWEPLADQLERRINRKERNAVVPSPFGGEGLL